MPDVFFYRCDQPGAPVLGDSANSLNALLYACLVAGFGSTGLVSITRTGSVATGSTASAHTFKVGDPILVAGADQAEYNGTFTVTAVAGNTLSWAVSGAPTTPATGTFTAKIAPAGWERPYSSGNVSVFRSADVTSSRRYFRLNDGLATDYGGFKGVEIKLYETMTAVSTGTLRATGVCYKAQAGATNLKWILVASGRTVYLVHSVYNAGDLLDPYMAFGDLNSYKAADSYNAFVLNSIVGGSDLMTLDYSATGNAAIICRPYTGAASAVNAYGLGPITVTTGAPAPGGLNPVDSAVPLVFPRLVTEDNASYGKVLRGMAPGVGTVLTQYGNQIASGTPTPSGFWERLSGVSINGTTRDVLIAATGVPNTSGVAIDLTGPWH